MSNIINTVELAVFLILPLILYYQKMQISARIYIPYIAAIYFIWFATYALLHESCHVLGSWITGARIMECRLIPHFWEGDIKNAYVQSELVNKYQLFFSPIFPYLRDILFLYIGYIILKRYTIKNSFITGLVLTVFVLSPIFDVFNNYFAFALGAKNDFYCISGVIGQMGVHVIGLFFTLAGLAVLWKIFQMIGKQPNIK